MTRNKMTATTIWFVQVFVAVLLWHPIGALSGEKQVVGLIEKVRICPGGVEVKAKLDTGARNSSLGASRVVKFKRNGKDWVRFDVVNGDGKKQLMERKIVRLVKIKQHGTMSAGRYVIKLGICLGQCYREVDVNLANRSGYNYQMLVGRSFLRGAFIIDPSRRFTTQPTCTETCGN